MVFLVLKITIYLALIILGYIKTKSTGDRKYLLFSILGILDITTHLLDKFVFTSNLELFLIYDLTAIGLYFMFYYSLKNLKISGYLLLTTFTIFTILSFLFFIIDWPKTNNIFYSQYGYLNLYEYSLFNFFAAIILLIISTFVLLKIFRNDLFELNVLFIIFGIMSYFIGDIVKFGLGTHLLKDIPSHRLFLNAFLPIRLIINHGLIITGLIWKN